MFSAEKRLSKGEKLPGHTKRTIYRWIQMIPPLLQRLTRPFARRSTRIMNVNILFRSDADADERWGAAVENVPGCTVRMPSVVGITIRPV